MPLTAGDFSKNELFATTWGGSIGLKYALPTSLPLALLLGVGYSTRGFLPVSNITVPGSIGETTFLAGTSITRQYKTGLYSGGSMALGVAYTLPAASSRTPPSRLKILELKNLEFGNIFPIFRSY